MRSRGWWGVGVALALCLGAGSASAQFIPNPGAPGDPYGAPAPSGPPGSPGMPVAPVTPFSQAPVGPGFATPPPAAVDPPPAPPGPQRKGFTAGIGAGVTALSGQQDGVDLEAGTAMTVSGQLGMYVFPRLALLATADVVRFGKSDSSGDDNAQQLVIGLAAQLHFGRRSWLRLGAGGASCDGCARADGGAFSLAVGVDLKTGRRSAITMALQYQTAKYDAEDDDLRLDSLGITLGLQSF